MSDTYVAPSDNKAPESTELIGEVIHSAPVVVKEAKAGWKTTEFWAALVGAVLVNVDVVSLPDKFQGWVTAAIAASYILSRGVAKSGVPVTEPVTTTPS